MQIAPLAKPLSLSVYALVVANAIPLIGVLFFNWDAQLVLALYWIENLIIGVFNIIKMLIVTILKRQAEGLFSSAFFIVHYGIFCCAHGLLLANLLGLDDAVEAAKLEQTANAFMSIFADGLAVLQTFLQQLAPAILVGILVLLLSRLVSFIEHFILRGEVFTLPVNKLMVAPYAQIMIMHAGLMLGALALNYFQSPIWLLAIIVVFKMIVDYRQHRKRHLVSETLKQQEN